MPAFDHRQAQVSLRAHAIRFQNALRNQDEAALAELVLPRPPAWMLDPRVTRRAWLERVSTRMYQLPLQYGGCRITDIAVGRKAPWGKRDQVVVKNIAVSPDRGQTWRFIDGIPDAGRVMTDPAFVGLARHAARYGFRLFIQVSFGGGEVETWNPAWPEDHALLLKRMRRALPSGAARAKALTFIKALVRRYEGGFSSTAKRAIRSLRAPSLRAFDLRDAHLLQLRRFRVGWDAAEAGAPVLEPPRSAPELSGRDRAELLAAFEIVLAYGKLPPRAYVCDGKRVAISKAHAKLFPALSVSWDVGDGPSVDPKRPYGKRSYYEYDIAEALGIAPAGPPDEDGPTLTRAQEKPLRALHKSLRGAVRALLLHGTVPKGTFRTTRRGWERAR